MQSSTLFVFPFLQRSDTLLQHLARPLHVVVDWYDCQLLFALDLIEGRSVPVAPQVILIPQRPSSESCSLVSSRLIELNFLAWISVCVLNSRYSSCSGKFELLPTIRAVLGMSLHLCLDILHRLHLRSWYFSANLKHIYMLLILLTAGSMFYYHAGPNLILILTSLSTKKANFSISFSPPVVFFAIPCFTVVVTWTKSASLPAEKAVLSKVTFSS